MYGDGDRKFLGAKILCRIWRIVVYAGVAYADTAYLDTRVVFNLHFYVRYVVPFVLTLRYLRYVLTCIINLQKKLHYIQIRFYFQLHPLSSTGYDQAVQCWLFHHYPIIPGVLPEEMEESCLERYVERLLTSVVHGWGGRHLPSKILTNID